MRIGALTLAVSDIVGGNIFDVLFVGAADIAYRDGGVYHALREQDVFPLALTLMLAAILAAGLIHREMKGIGFEGFAILGTVHRGVHHVVHERMTVSWRRPVVWWSCPFRCRVAPRADRGYTPCATVACRVAATRAVSSTGRAPDF